MMKKLSWLSASFLCLLSVRADMTNLPVIEAESKPPLRWVGWAPDEIEEIKTSSGDQERSTKGLLDGKTKTTTFLRPLKGSDTSIRFKKPRHISQLAFLQGGYGNWSLPKKLLISVNGEERFVVELKNEHGVIQAVPVDLEVETLKIHVLETYAGQGAMPWGGFAGIGEAVYGPDNWSFIEKPLQPHQKNLRLTITAKTPTKVSAWVTIGKGRMTFDFPPLNVQAGTHDYEVSLASLVPVANYGFEPHAQHLEQLYVGSDDPSIPVRLDDVNPVEPWVDENVWSPLPELNFPVIEVDGETWTEGMSYQTAGRFGNSTYNGLLTELAGSSWFRAYTANAENLHRRQDFDLWTDGQQLDDTGRADAAWKVKLRQSDHENERIHINWTTMVMDRTLETGQVARYYYGILAPGFLVDSPVNLHLSSRGAGNLPVRSGAPDEEEGRFQKLADNGKGGVRRVGPSAVLTSEGLLTKPQTIRHLREPWIVAIWGIEDGEPTFWGDKAVAVLMTGDAAGAIKWTAAGLELPQGRWGVSTAFYGLLNDHWETGNVADRARLLARMLRTYPIECREYYRVEAEEVKVLDVFRYERWGDPQWQAPDYAPIPPIFSLAKDLLGWEGIPAGDALAVSSDIATPFGPWRWERGDRLHYSLPRFNAWHAAFPRRPEFEEEYAAVETEIGAAVAIQPKDFEPWRLSIVKRWTQGLLGGSYLSEPAREQLLDTARSVVDRFYSNASWVYREERFSKAPYYVSGWVDPKARPVMYGDPNSCVGQSAYSLYLYAKYSGDWETVRRLWPRVMDSLRIFEVLNDWAVPETTSREAIKYGAIDMDTIAYAGVVAMERMAEVLGEQEDYERLAYLRAKIGAATALRMAMPEYLDPDNRDPELYGVGFAEDGPAIEKAGLGRPNGLDHAAMLLAWVGEMPEMYDFYLEMLSPEFFYTYQSEIMDEYFSDWREMPFNKSRPGAHITMRSRLKDWPAEDLEEDMRVWLKNSRRELPSYLNSGMLGAYSGHETGVYLVNWEPARLVRSDYSAADGILSVELESAQPLTVDFATRGGVQEVRLDGEALPASALRQISVAGDMSTVYRVDLPHGGHLGLMLEPLSTSPTPKL
ncbi:MAG: hypothetical protein Q7Q73_15780 [Verrucomicrobiota bacterium JB024]|nr:hypothetical protein [Verrucomicrobiota bacterium JB024]